MAALMEDVMDFARGRTGDGLDANFEDIPALGVALEDVVAEMQAAHAGRQITADLRVTSTVHGYRGRLQQLLSNLLGNAVSHRAQDEPIEVAAWTKDGWLVLSVKNGGDPIPSDVLPKTSSPTGALPKAGASGDWAWGFTSAR